MDGPGSPSSREGARRGRRRRPCRPIYPVVLYSSSSSALGFLSVSTVAEDLWVYVDVAATVGGVWYFGSFGCFNRMKNATNCHYSDDIPSKKPALTKKKKKKSDVGDEVMQFDMEDEAYCNLHMASSMCSCTKCFRACMNPFIENLVCSCRMV
ncbi:hypothetical protein ACP70R_041679 [Stipagrostis hirtigluma subsp. patula]